MKQSKFAAKTLFVLMMGAASSMAMAQGTTSAPNPGTVKAPSTGGPLRADSQEGGAKTGKTGSDRAVKAPGASAAGTPSVNPNTNMSTAPGNPAGPLKPDNREGGAKTGRTATDNVPKSTMPAPTQRPTDMANPTAPGTPGGPYTGSSTEGGAQTGKTGSNR